jgi:hypothetical protein
MSGTRGKAFSSKCKSKNVNSERLDYYTNHKWGNETAALITAFGFHIVLYIAVSIPVQILIQGSKEWMLSSEGHVQHYQRS